MRRPNKVGRPVEFNDLRKRKFLAALRLTGILGIAAGTVGVTRETVRTHRKDDKDFDQAVLDALEDYADSVEKELQRRAVEGVEKPVFYQGVRCDNGQVREYSDPLLLAAIKRRRPEYREHSAVDLNVSGGVLIIGQEKTPEEWANGDSGDER